MSSQAWDPATLLDIGKIDDGFQCIGWKISKDSCTNKIGKEKRNVANGILRSMAILDIDSGSFEVELKKLASTLLCSKSRHNLDGKRHSFAVERWQRKIRDVVRRGGDTIMGEPCDTDVRLFDEMSDLLERQMRC